jgi:hypothetical protein
MFENVPRSVPQGQHLETGGWPTDLNVLPLVRCQVLF